MANSPFQVPAPALSGPSFGGGTGVGQTVTHAIMPGAASTYTSGGVTYSPGVTMSTSGGYAPPVNNSSTPSTPSAPASDTFKTDTISQAQGYAPYANLAPGAAGSEVQGLQNYLVQMGYLTPQQVATGPGVYGPQTTAAVAQLQKNLGLAPNPSSSATNPKSAQAMSSKYQGMFNSVQNTEAPQTQAEASATINQQTQQSTDPVFNAMANSMSPILDSLNQVLNNINNPALTATSLQSEYNNLAAQYNIPQTQAELLNYQNIMNGTEQDIRDEITSAGGTATDSQVLGMTSARNKVILKQYNALATNYQAAVSNVSNMMQYAAADQSTELQRQSMSASIAESIGSIEQQMATMGMTMEQRAQENYQKTLTTLGGNYQAFASTISPEMQPYVENVMGLQPGTLSDPQELQLLTNSSLKYMQLQIQAQRANIYGYTQGYTGTDTSGGTADSTVSAILGDSNPMGAYATDPNYTGEISNVYNSINSLGVASDPSQLTQYIQNTAPNSAVTGQMITQAAQATGTDPALLTSVLQHESNFGTLGVGAKTNNPGNQGNTGSATQSFPNMYAGVLATAQNLANRQNAVGLNPPAAPYTASYPRMTSTSNVSPFSQNNPINAYNNVSSSNTYTIQAGDGLRSIASKFGITSDAGLQAIVKINNIQDINKIQAGQGITIPMMVKDNATGQTGYINPSDYNSSTYTQLSGSSLTNPNSVSSQYQIWLQKVQQAQQNPVTTSPLNMGRLSRNANTALKNYLASPVYTAVSSGATYLARIDAAMKDPGSISDTSLADAIIKIETGGGQVTESQINTYFQGQSFSDKFAIQGDKIVGKGGVLSPQQRTDLNNLAKDVFSNYRIQYQQLYVQAMQNLQGQGIPLNYGGNFPDFLSLISNPK